MAVDVLGVLRRLGIEGESRGRRIWARCPFHSPDEHASWFIRDEPGTQYHGHQHCFTCKARGDIYDVVKHARSCTFKEALDWVRESEVVQEPIVHVRYEVVGVRTGIFAMPPEVVQEPLARWVSGARGYLESRGITQEQAERWGLGYAVDGRLAGRIVLPIRDRGRRLLNYAARSFVGDEKRYIMAGSKEGPDPGALFGEEAWRGDTVVVFEGGINGLAFERIADGIAFACLQGSNPSRQQIEKLATFSRVLVASDLDAAGAHAWQVLRPLERHVAEARRAYYPDRRDAADLAACGELAQVVRGWLNG